MSNDPKPIKSVVEQIRPGRTDRAILMDVANAVDSHTSMLATVVDQVNVIAGDVAELKGNLIQTNAKAQQQSSHDIKLEAELAEVKEQIKFVPMAARMFVDFMNDPRTKAVGRFIVGIIAAYAAAKGWKVLP